MKSTKAPEPPADDTVVNQAALQLDEEDFDEIMKQRPVNPAGKLGSTWGKVKSL